MCGATWFGPLPMAKPVELHNPGPSVSFSIDARMPG